MTVADPVARLLLEVERLLTARSWDEAIATAREALSAAQSESVPNSDAMLRALGLLSRAIAHRTVELSEESRALAKRMQEVALLHYGPADLRTARVFHDCALSLRSSGLQDESAKFSLLALEIADRAGDADLSLWCLRVLTTTLLGAQKYAEALEVSARLLGREDARDGEPSLKILANYQLGLCLLRLGHKRRAAAYLQRAIDLGIKHRPDAEAGELAALLREAQSESSA